jgi:hypothetical protein
MRDAQGKFQGQLLGNRIHLLTGRSNEKSWVRSAHYGLNRGSEISAKANNCLECGGQGRR